MDNNKPMVSTNEIQLGADYEDVVTGFVGTAIGRVTYHLGVRPSRVAAVRKQEGGRLLEGAGVACISTTRASG